MPRFSVVKADSAQQPNSSVPTSVGGISGTLKRKRGGDAFGSLSTSNPQSEIAKRQKYGTDCYDTPARGCGEESSGDESSGPRSIYLSVSQSIHEHDTETDKISFQGYQTAPDTNCITECSEPCSKHTWHKPPTQCSSISADEASPLETPKKSRTSQKDTMNVSNRKQHFIYTPDDGMQNMMRKYVDDVHRLFDDSRSEHLCWLHPSPPRDRNNGRPIGTIQCNFVWKDSSGKHNLHVNFGIVALIIEHHLTEEQMEGYVNKSWHLSHLCGNWTCCNWRHMTVESARINIKRNQCFPDATHCPHDPPCMKDRKRRLLVTLAISNQIRSAIESSRNDAKSTAGCQISTTTAAGFECGICGEDVLCCGDYRICRSLTSITKSQKALERLELCFEPSYEILKAVAYLKQIIKDLIREKEASDAVILQRVVAQPEVDQSAHWSQKHFSPYGQMLASLLD